MALRGATRGSSSRFDFKGASQTSPEQASAFSDMASDDGRNGGGFVIGGHTSSSKAQHLANEIASIEQRCDFLEERNKWLTDKLLRSQRTFIERSFVTGGKILLRHMLKAWREAMDLLRLEHQLEQQTASLDKCQNVAKELGAALAREQETSRKHVEARRQIEADFEELAQTHTRLKEFSDKQTSQINGLQRQMQQVMGGLDRHKSDAQSIIDSVDEIQARVREMKKEDSLGEPVIVNRAMPGMSTSTIEESMKLRDEAQNVMNSMSGLLNQSGGSSPERGDRRQQRAGSGRFGDLDRGSLGGSRSGFGQIARTPSPMEGRFQAPPR